MSESKLDQIVKGAAPPGTSVTSIPPRPLSPDSSTDETTGARSPANALPSDPLTHVPSSPPQIYLNLLILEASLRSQYLTLRARRRQNTFFLLLLAIWNVYFFYALFLQPREDGSGIGGSVYWVIEMAEKVALMGGAVTGILIWGTGQWERGVRWPRRFVGVANRGLRTVNCKMIVIKGPWWKEMIGHMAFLFPYSPFSFHGSSYHYIDASAEKKSSHTTKQGHEDDTSLVREEDLAPGGDYIKLLLLSKPFSPDFRENWELYRTEYWEKENERRSVLLQRLKKQEREKAKAESGWLWWTGWRGWKKNKGLTSREGDGEKVHPRQHLEKDIKQRLSARRSGSHSRNSSRSSAHDLDDRSGTSHSRRGSSSGSTIEGRRRSKAGSSLGGQPVGKLTPMGPGAGPQSPLAKRASRSSRASDSVADSIAVVPRGA